MIFYEADEDIGEIDENLQRLTVGIPNVSIDDLSMRYQRHTTGVSSRFSRLLHRVSQVIMCYHEHHHDDYSIESSHFCIYIYTERFEASSVPIYVCFEL